MENKSIENKTDWRIGITRNLVFLMLYVIYSIFEAINFPETVNIFSILILISLSWFAIRMYKMQRGVLSVGQIRNNFKLGWALIATFLFFSVSNLLMILNGELENDMGYLNILVILLLIVTTLTHRKFLHTPAA